MSVSELDAIVALYDLNTHPFYRAWREGTLPRATLAHYADEYAPFIRSIERGWATLGDTAHAAEEREHAALWDDFRAALATGGQPSCAEARALEDECLRSFADRADAIGALYAFEAQQPATAQSKLAGLRAHYGMNDEQTAYFRLHASDYGERDMLRERLAAETDEARVTAACERVCRAMWSALDGILACGA